MKKIQALILAAGKGKRIDAKEKPKVLYPLLGRPLILYSLTSLQKAGFKKPVVIIGFKGKDVQKLLQERIGYVWQRKQLGTGHAVLKAKEALKGAKSVLIIYGDMPFWKPETLKKLIESHRATQATLSLVTVFLQNPSFFKYGRIIRDKKGKILGSIEEKEASKEEKQIKECNPSCYLVETKWLWQVLLKIKKASSGEYYLTDILGLAISQNKKIDVLPIGDWKEVLGINTKQQLQLAEKILQKKASSLDFNR